MIQLTQGPALYEGAEPDTCKTGQIISDIDKFHSLKTFMIYVKQRFYLHNEIKILLGFFAC